MDTANQCLKCGKTLANSPAASLSAWLFRIPECRCEVSSAPPEVPVTTAKTSEAAIAGYQIGKTILGRYKVLSLLGEGGMGRVYHVFDLVDELDYAMKCISREHTDPIYMGRRLENEALASGSLSHKNIIALHKFGRMEDGSAYLIMEYVKGESLEHLLAVQKRFSSAIANDIFIEIASALTHAHEKGIVHRDLKPANVLLTDVGGKNTIKLADFGIAKILDSADAATKRLTQTGEIIGTPLFMSPEQCKGEALDARSDIYSFGCIMYQVLSGCVPFVGDNPIKIILKHISEPAPSLPADIGLHKNWNIIIQRCLAKEAYLRYQTSQELLEDLSRLRDQKSLRLYPLRVRRWSVRTISLAVIGIFLTVLIPVTVLSERHTSTISKQIISTNSRVHSPIVETPQSNFTVNSNADNTPDLASLDAVDLAAANKEFAVFLSEHADATAIEIDPDMADDLAKKRRNLFNKNVSDDAFEGFQNLYRVSKLEVLGCSLITDRGMRYILDNPHLRLIDVNLNSTPVIDVTARAFLTVPSLKVFSLENTAVTDEAFNIHNQSIQSLTLNKTSIGDPTMSYLKRFAGLRSLAIAHTRVTDDGIKQLVALPLCGFWVSDTGITDSAAYSIASMKDLNTLSVSGTQISGKFLKRLKSLKKLESLEIRRCPNISPDDIEKFQQEHKHCVITCKPKVEFFTH